jgi:hypothetical protein
MNQMIRLTLILVALAATPIVTSAASRDGAGAGYRFRSEARREARQAIREARRSIQEARREVSRARWADRLGIGEGMREANREAREAFREARRAAREARRLRWLDRH